jgi:hypothetical protein
MARQMDARNSHNPTPNFEGKRGVFGLKQWKSENDMVKRIFTSLYLFLPYYLEFLIIY